MLNCKLINMEDYNGRILASSRGSSDCTCGVGNVEVRDKRRVGVMHCLIMWGVGRRARCLFSHRAQQQQRGQKQPRRLCTWRLQTADFDGGDGKVSGDCAHVPSLCS